jgi:hypothetical protein
MQGKWTIQGHLSLLVRFAVVCGVVISVASAGAQENYQHHHRDQINTIGVDASASRSLLNLLSRDYSIAAMKTATPSSELNPMVIGPAALANPDVSAYLVHAYQAGLTVAIAYATQAQADRFEQLVEGGQVASCRPILGTPRMALYAVQKTTREQPEMVSRYCLPTLGNFREHVNRVDERWFGEQNRKMAGDAEEQWLSAMFALQAPPPPLQSIDPATGESVNLDSLSRKTHCSEFTRNARGDVQNDFFVTSLRNFDSQRDYYYVQSFVQYNPRVAIDYFVVGGGQPYLLGPDGRHRDYLSGTRFLFSEPATTTAYVSEYTNDRSSTISASVGYSGGFPEVSVSKSVTVGRSTKVIVPPVTIHNLSALSSGEAFWEFHPANPRPNVLYSVAASWVWYVDRAGYGNTPNEIRNVFSNFMFGSTQTLGAGVCGFPPPFPTFSVGAPEIDSVNPEAVQRGGGTFLIHGEHMYPGILRNVLLGGDALSPANIVPINDKEIRVVVPSSQSTGPNPIQVTTSFNGSVLPSNSDVTVKVK